MTYEELLVGIDMLRQQPDDQLLANINTTRESAVDANAQLGLIANRRRRRTARRSKHRKRWKTDREAFLATGDRTFESRPGDIVVVVSPWWRRKWMDYYDVEREL